MGQVPLERALSKLGIASRSQTRELVMAGRVAVNGKLVKDPGFLLVPETTPITIDGKPIAKAAFFTIMLNKLKGVLTTRSDEKGRRTVYDLLPLHLQHLHPVGRLDMASCGLLLMTTDTQLSNFLTDPANQVPRTYVVTVKGRIVLHDIQTLSKGLEDKGEILKAAKVFLRKASHKESHLIMELCEGKNREIRRMFEALGSEVTSLKRVAFGKLKLGTLEPGQYREVSKEEIL